MPTGDMHINRYFILEDLTQLSIFMMLRPLKKKELFLDGILSIKQMLNKKATRVRLAIYFQLILSKLLFQLALEETYAYGTVQLINLKNN